MTDRGFTTPTLDPADAAAIVERARTLRGAVLTMTTLAGSGHPGGSMSSMELLLTLYRYARLRPDDPRWAARDRVVVSHGHISPGVYSALADTGFFDLEDLVAHFRQAASIFEGHVERSVPGIEWSTGNLGQGLSAGVGMAIAASQTGAGWHTFVAMSDGEQMKGQVAEARRLARRHGLTDLTAVVDLNGVQISGHTADVMPVNVGADFGADGWTVEDVDGHDPEALYAAIARAVADGQAPHAVLAHTRIGHGVSFMEDVPAYHGRALTLDEYGRAMAELGLDAAWLERARERRSAAFETPAAPPSSAVLVESAGTPRTYDVGTVTDNRSAWGAALHDLRSANPDTPFAVFDCDLQESVKTEAFAKEHPGDFFECGVGEHNAAASSGAASASGVLAFWADFGVFGCDEVFNQQRLNDINEAHLKLTLTHCGVDVGEDGKTHQALDYVGSFREMFGWKVIVPADPNQTDRAVRAMARMPGCVAIAMGRSKIPVIAGEDGAPAFGGGYEFRYGSIDVVRDGSDAVALTMGTVAGSVVAAADLLRAEGASVGVAVVSSPLHLDDEAMRDLAGSAPLLVTVEDANVRTGLGASVAEWLALSGVATRFVRLGVDAYQSSGASKDVLALAGLDTDGITTALRAALDRC